MMRRIWLLVSLLVSTAANTAEEAAVKPAADPDFIPPSTAIFSGLDSAAPPDHATESSGQQMSQSINKALNIAPKNGQTANTATGPKPLDVAPLSVPDSPDKQPAGNSVSSGRQKENIPDVLLHGSATTASTTAEELPVIEIYTQEALIALINEDQHLHRVANIDECQLVKDIELHARVVMLPAFQYLWGDMLVTGTCTRKNVELGIEYIEKAAQQGLPSALEHLARYYAKGRYVQRDTQQAAILMHEAAGQGYLKAQLGWVDMLNSGLGSPLDYEEAYSWLHHSVIADEKQHKRATSLLARLSRKMPQHIVDRAKNYRWQ
jgi:hypothetical protein